MRATEIIRGVLDLIDRIDCPPIEAPVQGVFAQLFTQMSQDPEPQVYDNTPQPHVHGIESVTTAAGLGGLNGAKQPADLRSNSVSLYPNLSAKE